MLGEKWKELSEKEKQPYEQKAKADKARYEKEKEAYANVSYLSLEFRRSTLLIYRQTADEEDEDED